MTSFSAIQAPATNRSITPGPKTPQFGAIHELEKPSREQGELLLKLCNGDAYVPYADPPEGTAKISWEGRNWQEPDAIVRFKLLDLGKEIMSKLRASKVSGIQFNQMRCLATSGDRSREGYLPILEGGEIVTDPEQFKDLDPEKIIGVLSADHVDIARANPGVTLDILKECVPFPWEENHKAHAPGTQAQCVVMTNGSVQDGTPFQIQEMSYAELHQLQQAT